MRAIIHLGVSLAIVASAAAAQHVAGSTVRSYTSRKRLGVQWRYPPPMPERAKTFEDAIKIVRGEGDYRPLLLFRDGDELGKRADAFIPEHKESERSLLMTHWFRCVVLDRRIGEKKHMLHEIVAKYPKALVLLCTWDGKTVVPLKTTRPQGEFRAAMLRILRIEYKKDPAEALKRWLKMLDDFDEFERKIEEQDRRVLEVSRKRGKKGAARHIAKLKSIKKKYGRLRKREPKMLELGLRRKPRHKTIADFDDEAARIVQPSGLGGLLEKVRKAKEKK